ncbi:MAG: hypothetical protein LBV79_04465 [Candidatus Adiutrix sp.]|nr:hypothetical protein [Candidatus Adiutrix sp.]
MAVLIQGPAEAQLRPGGAGDSGGPVAISSDRMEADDPQGVVHFIGDVVARQGDMTMTCDRMDVYYLAQEKPEAKPAEMPAAEGAAPPAEEKASAASAFNSSSRQIDRVECRGNVLVLEGERQVSGETGLYLAQALPRRIVLTGNARVWQGQDSLTGHQVTYYLDSDRSLVESERGGRVRTIFNQEDGGQ